MAQLQSRGFNCRMVSAIATRNARRSPRDPSVDRADRLSHRLHKGLPCTGLCLAKDALCLGESFFDVVEVRE